MNPLADICVFRIFLFFVFLVLSAELRLNAADFSDKRLSYVCIMCVNGHVVLPRKFTIW